MFFALLYLFQLTLVWHQKSYPRITLNSWKPLYCIKLQRWDDESAWERRKYGPGHYALLCFVQGRPWRLVMLYWLLGEKKEVLQWLLAPISCHRNSPIRSHCQSRKALQRLLTNKLPCLGSKLPAFTEDPWKEKKKKKLQFLQLHFIIQPAAAQGTCCWASTFFCCDSCRAELERPEHDPSQRCSTALCVFDVRHWGMFAVFIFQLSFGQ